MYNKLDTKEMMNLFRRKSKEHGLKMTPQRATIYQEFLKARDHPSVDIIYRRIVKKIPNISFDTVNRTLSTFFRIGIATVVEGYGRPKRFDPDITIHHHLRCVQCDAIIDFNNKDYDNIDIPAEIQKNFTVLNKKVVLEGLCNKCNKKI
jgi:Fur family peroxide stress response transcriptional regulator